MFQLMHRHWVHVRGSEGKYWVSNDGLVWSTLSNRLIGSTDRKTGRRFVSLWFPRERTVLVANIMLDSFRSNHDNLAVDHIDRDRTNDTLSNLRLATRPQNSANRTLVRNKSTPYKCVQKDKQHGGYFAQVSRQSKRVFYRHGKCALTLALLVDDFLHDHDGEFAALNFPERKRLRRPVSV